jgi:replicative DNA helicase
MGGIAEQSVIGSIFKDRTCIPAVLSVLTPDDFQLDINRKIFAAIKAKYEAQEPIDPVTITEHHAYLAEIIESTPTATNVMEYAEIVKKASTQRQLKDLGFYLQEDDEPSEMIAEASNRLERLKQGRIKSVITPDEMCTSFMAYRANIDKAEPPYVPTGFTRLDNLLGGGLLNEGLYIMAARPGVGKTTCAVAIADNMARSNFKTLFITLEMSEQQLMAKRIAAIANIHSDVVLMKRLGAEEYTKVTRAASELSQRPLYINRKPSATVTDIANLALAVQGLRCIVVDYFGLIQVTERKKSRYEAMTDVSGDLKRLARRLGIPILCLAQLNRQNEQRGNKRPQLADLRDTGAIEQDADGVIFLHREDYYNKVEDKTAPSELEVILEKNRHGATGVVKMAMYLATSKITN